jgi:hypothetical protein
MKRIVPVFFVMYLFISCTSRLYYSSDWQSRIVTVDGKIPEWSDPLRFYDEENGINYTISNDHQNLYLCCSISNEILQIKILRSGLEFAIDTLGKKSFPVSIKYPIGNKSIPEPKRNTNTQSEAGSNGRFDRSAYKLKLVAEAKEMQLVGFKPPLERVISLSDQNNTGVSAAIDFDKMGNMYYEAVIPFSTFHKSELTPTDSNTVFNYRIKVNPAPNLNIGQGRSSGMRGGGMHSGGMRGGGMRSGRMGGGRMGGDEMSGGRMGDRMNGSGVYGGIGKNSFQRNTTVSGTTKITIKLKLAYR